MKNSNGMNKVSFTANTYKKEFSNLFDLNHPGNHIHYIYIEIELGLNTGDI